MGGIVEYQISMVYLEPGATKGQNEQSFASRERRPIVLDLFANTRFKEMQYYGDSDCLNNPTGLKDAMNRLEPTSMRTWMLEAAS
uniref:DUF1330 domain-containing protein n=1 Tax=Ascaris lumbricoides TaxID=6252 RepID=A0A0M3HNC7_ASCLU